MHTKANDELFVVDVTGDERGTSTRASVQNFGWAETNTELPIIVVRKSLPKYSKAAQTSTKILAQRSAVPAVVSRATAATVKRKRLTHEDKDRLLRMGKRPRKGPFNAVMDTTEVGAGSALLELSEAAKQSGRYDVWGTDEEESEADEGGEFVPKAKKPKVRKIYCILCCAELKWHCRHRSSLTPARRSRYRQSLHLMRAPRTTRHW